MKPRVSFLVEKRSFPEPHSKPDIPHCDTPRIPHFADNTCKLPSALRRQCSALPCTHNLKHFLSLSHTFQTTASSRRVAFRSQELMANTIHSELRNIVWMWASEERNPYFLQCSKDKSKTFCFSEVGNGGPAYDPRSWGWSRAISRLRLLSRTHL